ncbi:MAG: DUF134 domain-containing protein [Methanoregula sp.]|nr:MAG: DUF134 domain-containing protein [Methanoregula sp.]
MTDSEELEIPRCPRRGRPRIRRIINNGSQSRCYKPCCCPEEDSGGITLRPDELELLRLVDLEGLEQEEAAEKLGVSRKTAWRDLHQARRKITEALVFGKGIQMEGCQKAAEGRCPKCLHPVE